MKKPGGNNLLPNYIDPNLSFEQEPIGGGGGYPSKENTSEEAYKRLTIHVTYYTNEGSTGTFFVKETLEWLTNPKSRRTDYLGISTDGSFLLKKLDENAEKLDFNLKLSYDYHKEKIYSESSYKSPIIEDSEVVESFDINNANYKLEGSNLLVGCKLPEDFYYDYTDEYDLRIIENTYTNFVISLTANFVPLYQNPIEGRFRGLHLHEKNETYVTIDKITLRPEFPYFSISVSLDSNLAFDDVSVNVALDL